MEIRDFFCNFAANFERRHIMQIAINPTLYGSAQTYAEKQGLNLTAMIEDFLRQFISPAKAESTAKTSDITPSVVQLTGKPRNITPRVQRFKRGNPWHVSDEEVDKMRHEYLMEKYQ